MSRVIKFLAGWWLCSSLTIAVGAEALLLKAARVHTISTETYAPGQVLIQDGKIKAVGRELEAAGAQVLDLHDQDLYPGLISLNCVLGLTEIGSVRATEDYAEVGQYNPDVRSWIAVNPDSELIPVARANGISHFEPAPASGVVAGYSGLVATEGWTFEDMTVKKPVALHVFWPSLELQLPTASRGERGKSLEEQGKERKTRVRELDDFFQEAKAYARAVDAKSPNGGSRIPAWEAMLPAIRGEVPLIIHADDVRQIKAAAAWAGTNHFKWILAGGRDAWLIPDLLAKDGVPVLYSHVFSQPWRGSDRYDVHFRAPEVLRAAGVRVIFSMGLDSFDAPLVKNLPYAAAQAVAFGLSRDEALKGLTLYPAEVAGVGDRLGSIAEGKEATIFSCTGDILDIRSRVTRFWIAGKEVPLLDRHTRLYQKYKDRP